MPNQTQIEFLDELIGPEGTYFELIQEDISFDLGTKVLYLERAIHLNCRAFLRALDKLYDENLVGEAKTSNEEFIRALKLINDLYFNNQVKYDVFGTRPALMHYFGSLGDVHPDEFRALIQQITESRIAELQEGNLEQVAMEKAARIESEAYIIRQTGWRELFDLPVAQLPSPAQAPGFFDNHIIILVHQNIYHNLEFLRGI